MEFLLDFGCNVGIVDQDVVLIERMGNVEGIRCRGTSA